MSHEESIGSMYDAVAGGRGYSAIIVVSTNSSEAEYWQERLEATRRTVAGAECAVYSVMEEWRSPQGAGNLLGTLNAWRCACGLASLRGHDLRAELAQGDSIAMYHTAGKGTRLAPLVASEMNSKSMVKMPRLIEASGRSALMTMLEATIFQTSLFAETRGGRLCVWWGDQVFIPERYRAQTGHPAEILAKRERVTRELENYGIVIPTPTGAAQREKVRFERILEMVEPGADGDRYAYKSLGSFSVDFRLLDALLEEFAGELERKAERLETDHHLWQPLTSTLEEYTSSGKGAEIWRRLAAFRDRFLARHTGYVDILDYLDIGSAWWWDYGRTALYYQNVMKILSPGDEGRACRLFFGHDAAGSGDSLLVDSRCVAGAVKESVLLSSHIARGDLAKALVVESAFGGSVEGRGLLLYAVAAAQDLRLDGGTVLAGTCVPGGEQIILRSALDRDGKDDWDGRLPGNSHSYGEIYDLLRSADRSAFEAQKAAHRAEAFGRR